MTLSGWRSALGRLSEVRTTADVTLPDEVEELWAAVRRLPRRQAQAIALHYVEDRSVAEAASLMGCAEGTVKVQLHRARRRLALALPHPETAIVSEGRR